MPSDVRQQRLGPFRAVLKAGLVSGGLFDIENFLNRAKGIWSIRSGKIPDDTPLYAIKNVPRAAIALWGYRCGK